MAGEGNEKQNAKNHESDQKSAGNISKLLSTDQFNSICYYSNIVFSTLFIFCSFYIAGTLVFPKW